MRFHSTPESAQNLEITKLAIIETVLSVAIYVCAGLYLGTFKYLALAVVIAPLMLFRTKESAEWGIVVYRTWNHKIGNVYLTYELKSSKDKSLYVQMLININNLLIAGLALATMPLVGITIRLTATIYWWIRRPLPTLKQAPENWLRQGLCTDFFHPPEIVPLEALRWADKKQYPTFNSLIDIFRNEKSISSKLITLMLTSPFFIIGFLPSLTYRITFKATSIAYLPFIWVIRETLSSNLPVKERLKRFKDSEIEKVRRIVSWAVVATLIGKLGLVYRLVDLKTIEDKFPSKKIVESIVIPAGWPWWQITIGVEAALTFVLFFFADAALARIEANKIWWDEFALKTVSTISFLRATLSLVTISYFFYVALNITAPGLVNRLLGT